MVCIAAATRIPDRAVHQAGLSTRKRRTRSPAFSHPVPKPSRTTSADESTAHVAPSRFQSADQLRRFRPSFHTKGRWMRADGGGRRRAARPDDTREICEQHPRERRCDAPGTHLHHAQASQMDRVSIGANLRSSTVSDLRTGDLEPPTPSFQTSSWEGRSSVGGRRSVRWGRRARRCGPGLNSAPATAIAVRRRAGGDRGCAVASGGRGG